MGKAFTVATCAIVFGAAEWAVGAALLLAQGPSSISGMGIVQALSNITAMGLLAYIIYTVTQRTIPDMVSSFRAECQEQRGECSKRAEVQDKALAGAIEKHSELMGRLVESFVAEKKEK